MLPQGLQITHLSSSNRWLTTIVTQWLQKYTEKPTSGDLREIIWNHCPCLKNIRNRISSTASLFSKKLSMLILLGIWLLLPIKIRAPRKDLGAWKLKFMMVNLMGRELWATHLFKKWSNKTLLADESDQLLLNPQSNRKLCSRRNLLLLLI